MTINRRCLLTAGAGAAVGFGAGAASGLASVRACEAPPTEGVLTCDAAALDACAEDFGHIVRKRPQAVFKAARADDTTQLMQWAGNRGVKVAPRGQGHSIYGRAMVENGIVLDMGDLRTIHRVESDRVVVDAGATWSTVLDATLAHGLTPPVLPNYLGLSVGGTLAVGGIGGTSYRYGMQTDNVVALTVATGDGRALPCSADALPDLFDAVRAGLCQCAVITSATLRLVRAPERVRRFHLFYPDLRSLVADQRRALDDGRFDHLQGAILPDGSGGWRYQLEGVVFYSGAAVPNQEALLGDLADDRGSAAITDATYREDLDAFMQLEKLLRSKGQWSKPHPWLLTFLGGANAVQVVGDILSRLTQEDLGTFGRVTFYPMTTAAMRTPLVRLPKGHIVFPFNIIRMPETAAADRVAQLIDRNRLLFERIRNAGGLQYPVSAFAMSSADWRDHFGPHWIPLREAKSRYDPRNTLASGYEVF